MRSYKYKEMTFAALSRCADSVVKDDMVADVLGGEDYREIATFLEHDTSTRPNGDKEEYTTVGKRIIGVALCDLDDPQADVEVLDRDQAWAMFGREWVERMEYVA